MMAKCNLCCAELGSHPVQCAAPQPRTQGARCLALRDQAFDDGVGVLRRDMKGDAHALEISRKHIGWEPWLFLVQIDRNEVKIHGRPRAQAHENIEHSVGILAARQADHHAVPRFDHSIVANRAARFPHQALGELVALESQALVGAVRALRRGGRGRFRQGSVLVHVAVRPSSPHPADSASRYPCHRSRGSARPFRHAGARTLGRSIRSVVGVSIPGAGLGPCPRAARRGLRA